MLVISYLMEERESSAVLVSVSASLPHPSTDDVLPTFYDSALHDQISTTNCHPKTCHPG
jgi:hypothetical protein